MFDLILFNPPYVPTTESEVGCQGIGSALAGGENGMQVTDQVLELLPKILSPTGAFYMVAISDNNPDEILRRVSTGGLLVGEKILQRTAGRERLSILKIERVV